MAGKSITVACKLPNGLHLQLRDRKTGEFLWDQVLNGNAVKRNSESMMPLPGQPISDQGFGLTFNVDEDKFELWCVEYADHPAVKGRLIFAQPDQKSLIAQMKENEGRKTGLDPMSQTVKGVAPRDDKEE